MSAKLLRELLKNFKDSKRIQNHPEDAKRFHTLTLSLLFYFLAEIGSIVSGATTISLMLQHSIRLVTLS